MVQIMTSAQELEAFSPLCPEPGEVIGVLEGLGLELTFSMDAVIYPAYSQTPDLPAQFHFRAPSGTEVIYLAGHDANTEGVLLPPHASRWWLLSGADLAHYQQVVQTLTARWSLFWQHEAGNAAGQPLHHAA